MDLTGLDRDRVRELFDLRSSHNLRSGGDYRKDPYPDFHALREGGPLHRGTAHDLLGHPGDFYFEGLPYPELEHYTAFDFASCDEAFRDSVTFASSPGSLDRETVSVDSSLLSMNGAEHRRYRGLVQPSFVPAKMRWWSERWIEATVQGLIDHFIDEGRADLNVDFCAAIPILTITGSFGIPVTDALALRQSLRLEEPGQFERFLSFLQPIVAARRDKPEDDLISVLVQAELEDEDGAVHRLSDVEIYTFSFLLLVAGSGTTWKQMGITLTALLTHPDALEAARRDRAFLKAAIEEALRWTPTDPVFARFVTRDVDDFHGTPLPKGSVLHLCLAAANRDPNRWEDPDSYNPWRPPKSAMAFGNGPHICLGMHVARAEMATGIGALLDRLANLRLNPDAPPPQMIGLYERGPTEIEVLFG